MEDARGNKVCKEAQPLSRFGVAAVDFTLADEVNMGVYTLRALLPEGQSEKKVRVERYVLPKFKSALTTDKPFYLPGETVNGSVQADYFFGKPVAGGNVTVEVETVDIGVNKLAELAAKRMPTATTNSSIRCRMPSSASPLRKGRQRWIFMASSSIPPTTARRRMRRCRWCKIRYRW